MQNKFDINAVLSPKSFAALFNAGGRKNRDKFRTIALRLLKSTHELNLGFNENVFRRLLNGMEHGLTDAQKPIVLGIYLDASNAYQEWCSSNTKIKSSKKRINSGFSHLHGGEGYTGRLKVGFAAPHGSESFQSDSDPRDGLKRWVKKLTAGGAGTGYSLSELSGGRQPKSYGSVMSPEELRLMTKNQLLSILDTTTSTGTFLRAVLAYYNQPMNFSLGNFSVHSANINNPENWRSVTQLDSIYNYMKGLDKEGIINATRAVRFLVLSEDLLELVKIRRPRGSTDICEDKERELRMAKMEIAGALIGLSPVSDLMPDEMRTKIDADKRKKQWQILNSVRATP